MTDRDEVADALRAYRQATAMPPARRAANLQRARQRLAAGTTPDLDVSLPASSTAGAHGPLIVKILGGIGAAAVAWAVASGTDDTGSESPVPSVQAQVRPEASADEEVASVARAEPPSSTRPSARAEKPLDADEPALQAAPSAPAPTPAAKETKPVPRARRTPTPPRSAGDLSAEVDLLKRAQLAQAKGQPARALEILREHRRRFPDGRMAEAREVARMTALCTLGREPELAKAKARFLAEHADSAHAARVRNLCTDDTP